MKQLNNLIEFHQAICEYDLTKAQDAQFELVDALLLSSRIRSFPELSLSPVFRREWPSVYVAIEDGEQDREWLDKLCVGQIPTEGVQVFSLDGTAWPYPEARTLLDRQYAYSLGEIVKRREDPLAVGHQPVDLANHGAGLREENVAGRDVR